MFTQIYLFILFYLISNILMFMYFFSNNVSSTIIQKPFPQVWATLTLYHRQSWLFKFLILQLSGLPPVFFFFIKFSFLIGSLNNLSLIFFILAFLNILFGIFFYLKIFSTTNLKISNIILKNAIINNPILVVSKKTNVKKLYSSTYYIILFIFINIFSIIFFLDFYIILFSWLGF